MALVQALSMIKRAMLEIGAIDVLATPGPEQTQVVLEAMNDWIDSQATATQAAFNNLEVVVSLPAGTPSLTIGPGKQIDVPRPLRIEMAYARLFNLDRPIRVIEDKAEWDSILIKSLGTSWPDVLWYDQGLPTGNVYFWPRPSGAAELHITVATYVTQFASANAKQELSAGYKRAIELNTALEIAPMFNLPVSADLQRRAAMALRMVKRANHKTPQLEIGEQNSSRLGRFLSGM